MGFCTSDRKISSARLHFGIAALRKGMLRQLGAFTYRIARGMSLLSRFLGRFLPKLGGAYGRRLFFVQWALSNEAEPGEAYSPATVLEVTMTGVAASHVLAFSNAAAR